MRRKRGHLAVASQTRQALKNPGAVPAVSGVSFDGVVRRVGMFTTVEEDFTAMEEVYETFVSEPYLTRKTAYTGLPKGLRVEIETIAVVDRNSGKT